MSNLNNFAAFILSHGRPDNVKTYSALRAHGYTGKIFILIDDQDKFSAEYKKNYPDEVIIFNKKNAASCTDAGDNFKSLSTVLFARNASFEVAKSLGLEYFIQLDDDYSDFRDRFDTKFRYKPKPSKVVSLDRVFSALLDFYKDNPRIASLAIAQGGDFIGGRDSYHASAVMHSKKMHELIYLLDEEAVSICRQIKR